jgi:hypothetical protein
MVYLKQEKLLSVSIDSGLGMDLSVSGKTDQFGEVSPVVGQLKSFTLSQGPDSTPLSGANLSKEAGMSDFPWVQRIPKNFDFGIVSSDI